jgi:hypothetical protein
MRHGVQEWGTAAFERLKIHGFMVWRASLPTPREDAHPCEGQGADGCLVRRALVALRLGVALSPPGMPGGGSGPLHPRLSQARRPLEVPGAPRCLAAAFRHGRHTGRLWECRGRSVACPLCPTGPEEARGQDGTGAGQGVQQRAGGRVLGAWREGCLAVSQGWQRDAALGHTGLPQEGVGGDDACRRGPRPRARDGLDAGREDLGSAHVMRPEEALQRGAPREVCRVARRPGPEEVAQERGIVVLQPLQDVG